MDTKISATTIESDEIKQLKEKIQFHEALIDNSVNWETFRDISGNIIYISPSFEHILGYRREDYMSGKLKFIDLVYPEDRTEAMQMYQKQLNRVLFRDFVCRVLDAKGKLRFLSISSNPVYRNNEYIGFRTSISDVTTFRNLEDELRKKEAMLSELNKTKDVLFSIIAHDLRAPFNGILGFAELMLLQYQRGNRDNILHFSENIKHLATNTLGLLDNLLGWAKIQTGQILFTPQNIILNDIVSEEIISAQPSAEIKNIKIEYTTTNAIGVTADENMLRIVLRNLLSNAIKYSRENGLISIDETVCETEVVVKIADNGVGINKEKLKTLFQISRNMGTAEDRSSGLGLILCREFVEKMNGQIWVESETGKGSCFMFTLPVGK